LTYKKKKDAKSELNILDRISADDALVILTRLAQEDTSLLGCPLSGMFVKIMPANTRSSRILRN